METNTLVNGIYNTLVNGIYNTLINYFNNNLSIIIKCQL